MSKFTSAQLSEIDQFRYDVLCGLMAAPRRPAVDEAIYRRLLFSGELDARTHKVRRSFPSLAEHIGRDRGEEAEDHNRQVREAHKRLRADGLVQAVRELNGRKGRGRGYAYHHVLPGRFESSLKAHSLQAYWAAKRMSIQVSPIGPTLEQTFLRVWWKLDSDGARTWPIKEWADALGHLHRATALRRLRQLADRGVGVTFEELPPEARQEGEVGRKPKRYRITAVLPPKGRLPDGARRHRERQRQEQEMLRELRAPVAPAEAPVWYMVGPNGAMVPAPLPPEHEDLPEEFFGASSGEFDETEATSAVLGTEEGDDSPGAGLERSDDVEAAPQTESVATPELEDTEGAPTVVLDDAPTVESQGMEDAPAVKPKDSPTAPMEPSLHVAMTETASTELGEDRPAANGVRGPLAPDVTAGEAQASGAESDAPARLTPEEVREKAIILRRQLWYPELVDKLIEDAEGLLQEGHKVTLGRRVHNFYEPVIAAQNEYGSAKLIERALNETHRHGTLRKPRNRTWDRHFTTICINHKSEYTGDGPPAGTNAAAKAARSPEKLRPLLRERLLEAYDANKNGRRAEADALLLRMLGAIPDKLAPALYDGDVELARGGIIEAFKRGSGEELHAPLARPLAFLDYLPESTWPHEALLACEVAAPGGGEVAGAASSSTGGPPPASSRPVVVSALDVERAPLPIAALYPSADEDLPDEFLDLPVGNQPEPKLIGTQLALDGRDGPELVRQASGVMTYRAAEPPRRETAPKLAPRTSAEPPEPAHAPLATGIVVVGPKVTPEMIAAMRAVGVEEELDAPPALPRNARAVDARPATRAQEPATTSATAVLAGPVMSLAVPRKGPTEEERKARAAALLRAPRASA